MRQEGTLKSLLGDTHPSWPLWIQLVFFCCIWSLSLKAICIQCTYTFVPYGRACQMGPALARSLWKVFYQQNDQWLPLCAFLGLMWGGVRPVGVRVEGLVSLESEKHRFFWNTRTDGVFLESVNIIPTLCFPWCQQSLYTTGSFRGL